MNSLLKTPFLGNFQKRFFWKISEKRVNVFIKGIGKTGTIFTHNNISCSLSNFITETGESDLPSGTVVNSFNLSCDKYPDLDIDLLEKYMNENKRVQISMETHMIGSPTKGFTLHPRYLTKINTPK